MTSRVIWQISVAGREGLKPSTQDLESCVLSVTPTTYLLIY